MPEIIYGQVAAFNISLDRITEADDTRITESDDTRITEEGLANQISSSIIAQATIIPFNSLFYVKVNGVWKEGNLLRVKYNGEWVNPIQAYKNINDFWTRIY
jgi:hypothetical protein